MTVFGINVKSKTNLAVLDLQVRQIDHVLLEGMNSTLVEILKRKDTVILI